jgi:hypothetical protein
MESERYFSGRFKQLWEKATDILHRSNQEGHDRQEKTMVERERPAPVHEMKGPMGESVRREVHYANVRREDAQAMEKNKHLFVSREAPQPPKFALERKNELGSTFNRRTLHEREPSGRERER